MDIETTSPFSRVTELSQEHVIVKDRDEFNKKLTNLLKSGAEKLQIITDFDSTLTKAVVDGKPTAHSIEVFAKVKSLSKEYHEGCNTLEMKFGPMVSEGNKTEAELQKIYYQWWDEFEKLNMKETVSLTDIHEAVDSTKTPLRDGCDEMMNLLSRHKVPVIVVSAGIGEVVNYTLRDYEVKIVANFMNHDKDYKFIGFTRPTVSVYNKDEIPLPVDDTRENIILLGDSLGDYSMANGVKNIKTILKVGFYTGEDKKILEEYCNRYDVVLVKDQTMYTVIAILRFILDT